MIMPRTPRFSARLAAKAAVSPLSSKNPVESRSTLPHCQKQSPDETGDPPRAALLDPRFRHYDVPPLPTDLPSRGFRTPHRPHIGLRDPPPSTLHWVSPRPCGTTFGRASFVPTDPRGLYASPPNEARANTSTLRPITVSLRALEPCRPFPPARSPPHMHPPTSPVCILTLPSARSLRSVYLIVLTIHPSPALLRPLPPPHFQTGSAAGLLALASQFSSQGLRATLE